MFEKEAKEYTHTKHCRECSTSHCEKECILVEDDYKTYKDGAEFGYNKAKEELTERLDDATEIIGLMKDLFFDCWQEKGLKAIKFEQRVNDFLKGE